MLCGEERSQKKNSKSCSSSYPCVNVKSGKHIKNTYTPYSMLTPLWMVIKQQQHVRTYVKSKKKDPCSVSPLRSEGVLMLNATGTPNILNNQYCSVFTKEDTTNIPSKGPSQTPDIPTINVSVNTLKTLLQELKPHKASGPDNKGAQRTH